MVGERVDVLVLECEVQLLDQVAEDSGVDLSHLFLHPLLGDVLRVLHD